MSVLMPLGPWGVLTIALVDAAALGIPMDPVIAAFVYKDPRRTLIYVLMGAIGSAVGSLVPYLLGYTGGEAFVVRKVGRAKFARVHALSEKYGDLALIIPAMLPPPTPFKLFVFSAGVLEMTWLHFMLSVFVGRVLRFAILSVLTIEFGPEIVQIIQTVVKHHSHWAIGILCALILLGVILYIANRKRSSAQAALV